MEAYNFETDFWSDQSSNGQQQSQNTSSDEKKIQAPTHIQFPQEKLPKVGLSLKSTVLHSPITDPDDVCYVLSISENSDNTVIGAAGSNLSIKLFNTTSLQQIGQLQGSAMINEIQFARTQPNLLFTAANDGVKLWDLRQQQTISFPSQQGEHFSIGVHSTDQLLASGANGNVVVWDVRMNKQFRLFEGFHSEDITCVRFHPKQLNYVFSSSVDGNVCGFDVSPESEDDALISGINIEDSINRIDFFGENYEYIAVLNTTEKFSIWTIDGGRMADFGDVRERQFPNNFRLEYMVGCKYDPLSNLLFVLVGNHSGTAALINVTDPSLPPLMLQSGSHGNGHTATVRTFDWTSNGLFTGAEDSTIAVWSPNDSFREYVQFAAANKQQTAQLYSHTPVTDAHQMEM